MGKKFRDQSEIHNSRLCPANSREQNIVDLKKNAFLTCHIVQLCDALSARAFNSTYLQSANLGTNKKLLTAESAFSLSLSLSLLLSSQKAINFIIIYSTEASKVCSFNNM